MGKEKGENSARQNWKEKGRNYGGGKKKAFTTDEGPVGGKEKSRRKEITKAAQERWVRPISVLARTIARQVKLSVKRHDTRLFSAHGLDLG
jgi:hypothetical protein